MMYEVQVTPSASKTLKKWKKSNPNLYKKYQKLFHELVDHPRTGTGHPEPLKGSPEGRWSREITKKHRMVYRIFDTEIVVLVLAAYGHYDDK